MSDVITCPICDEKTFNAVLSCTDFTVSKENFLIKECSQCKFLLTSPRPENPGDYYLSQSYISHSRNAATTIDKIYLLARQFTLRWKLELINKTIHKDAKKTLLDYGCGTGEFLKTAKLNGWQISGVEPSDIARTQSTEATQINIKDRIESLTSSEFDVITLWHVLEHIQELNETLEKLISKLSDSGTMFIAVPNYNSWDAKHYSTFWAAYDVPRHLWHFSQSNMEKILKKNKLHITARVPMKLDAIYVSLLSEKNKNNGRSTVTNSLRAIINGMKSNLNARTTTEYSSIIYIARK